MKYNKLAIILLLITLVVAGSSLYYISFLRRDREVAAFVVRGNGPELLIAPRSAMFRANFGFKDARCLYLSYKDKDYMVLLYPNSAVLSEVVGAGLDEINLKEIQRLELAKFPKDE
jgi:hypothetical protein